MPRKKKKKSSIGCLFWVAFVLLLMVIFLFSRTGLDRLIMLTGINETIEDQEDNGPEVRRIEPHPEPQEKPPATTQPRITPSEEQQQTEEQKEDVQLPEIVLEVPEAEMEIDGREKEQSPSQQTSTAALYFVRVHDDGTISLEKVERAISSNQAPLTTTLETLLQGINSDELNQGLVTFISDNTRLNRVYIQEGVAYLDFSENIRFNSFGREGLKAELKQIIYTATEFSTVVGVQILIDGEKREFLASEGIYIGSPLNRNSFS